MSEPEQAQTTMSVDEAKKVLHKAIRVGKDALHADTDTDPEKVMGNAPPEDTRKERLLNTLRTAHDITDRATMLVGGDRQAQHGPKLENMTKIAAMWNAWFIVRKPGPINAHDVAVLNAMQKFARTQSGEFNVDDYVDAAGYAGIAGEVMQDILQQFPGVAAGVPVKAA